MSDEKKDEQVKDDQKKLEQESASQVDLQPDDKSPDNIQTKPESPKEQEKAQDPEQSENNQAKITENQDANNQASLKPDDLKSAPSSTAVPKFNAKPAPKLSAPQKQSKGRSGLIVSVVILVLALAGISWTSYNQYLMQQNWQNLQTELNQSAKSSGQISQAAQQTAQTSLQNSGQNQNQINRQAQLISQLRQALTATQERVRELSGRQKQDWLLAEAEYLIKLAEYKITLEKDKNSAIALLKTADQRVMPIADNSLIELRQIIANDIANLQLVVAPDVSGISAQLKAVASQVASLDLKALEFTPIEQSMEQAEESSKEFSWQGIYTNFLDDFVKVKHHDEARKPLMTPEQRGNLNANVQLALQQAQIAMLRAEQGFYQSNLGDAKSWVTEFFVDNEKTTTVVSNLDKLAGYRVVIDLPKQLESKSAIQAINQQRLYQWLEKTTPATNNSDSEAGSQLPETQL
ncbi:MAG: uroporphyrinogen-III C-methyltransferase [Kangiellaceae bacterium]|nr:uroporphyrinogen-III C-methyltransferase [Kangiellaceae bacterium]